MSALDDLLKRADTGELSNIEWCIYWADLTNTDEDWTEKPKEAAAELLALRERVAELESERRFIDGIVMGDGNHDKVMLTKDAMIFMECMKLLGLDVSGCGPESIVDAITALKSQ